MEMVGGEEPARESRVSDDTDGFRPVDDSRVGLVSRSVCGLG